MLDASPIRLAPALRRCWLLYLALVVFGVVATTRTVMVASDHWYIVKLWLSPFNIFGDFRAFSPKFAHLHQPDFWTGPWFPLTYPAPMGVCLALLFKLRRPMPLYITLLVGMWAWWHWYLARRLADQGVRLGLALACNAMIAITAWPMWFQLESANVQGLVGIVMGFALLAAVRARWTLAAVLLGLATAMKLYPFMLLGLLLSQRRYREFVLSVAVAAAVTVLSLAYLGPSIAEANRGVLVGMEYLRDHYVYVLWRPYQCLDHSIFSMVRYAIMHDPALAAVGGAGHMGFATPLQVVQERRLVELPLKIYTVLAAAGGIAIYVLRLRKLPVLNQLLGLSTLSVLLPPVSVDYTLLDMAVPFGMLCLYAANRWRAGVQVKGVTLCLLCCPLIFVTGQSFYDAVPEEWTCPWRTIGLLVLLYGVTRYRFDWPGAEMAHAAGRASA